MPSRIGRPDSGSKRHCSDMPSLGQRHGSRFGHNRHSIEARPGAQLIAKPLGRWRFSAPAIGPVDQGEPVGRARGARGSASPWVSEEHASSRASAIHRTSRKAPRIVDLSSLASRRSLATSPTATSAARTATPSDLNLAKVRESDDGVRPSRAAISRLS